MVKFGIISDFKYRQDEKIYRQIDKRTNRLIGTEIDRQTE